MVMESSPSAQCVGREFVRQYYTLLHEAPQFLHRFYSNQSSFIHGGVEKPGEEQTAVMGQTEIHKKIMSLNFRDCHAKIRQVDSQSTVANAVVVQVTGELSNNGEPMRRFMQTFVLNPQSPKKYYVHNDIFRYQDEVFIDSEPDVDVRDEQNAEADGHVVDDNTIEESEKGYYNVEKVPEVAAGGKHLSNGNEKHEEVTEQVKEELAEALQESENTPSGVDEEGEEFIEEEDGFKDVQELEQTITETDNKPRSWAQLAGNQHTAQPSANIQPANKKPQVPAAAVKPDVKVEKTASPKAKPSPAPRVEPVQQVAPATGEGDKFNRSVPFARNFFNYPDNCQIFVGNLPNGMEENELKEFFETFGKVIDVRIQRKNMNYNVPNFGFVAFEDSKVAQQILDSRPVMYKEHRLNVEEKKAQNNRPSVGGNNRGAIRGGRGGGSFRGGGGRGGQINVGGSRPSGRGGFQSSSR